MEATTGRPSRLSRSGSTSGSTNSLVKALQKRIAELEAENGSLNAQLSSQRRICDTWKEELREVLLEEGTGSETLAELAVKGKVDAVQVRTRLRASVWRSHMLWNESSEGPSKVAMMVPIFAQIWKS